MLGVSRDTVRRMFADEPGSSISGAAHTKGKRRYRVLRIPSAVVDRVLNRMSMK